MTDPATPSPLRTSPAGLPLLPSGSIQFFDGYFPALPARSYDIGVRQQLSAAAAVPSFSLPPQTFIVQAPEFAIDPGCVQTVYPPAGSAGRYDQQLPFLVLDDPALPWERSLVPGSPPTGSGDPTPWLALLIFADSELLFPPGSDNPVSTGTVAALLRADPDKNVLKPALPPDWVGDALLASTCQTITIPGATFAAIMPSTTDLPYLAHCRGVNSVGEGEQLLSVLLGNRLAVAGGGGQPAAPVRYHAHLVSLEGYHDYLAPGGKTIPAKPAGGPMDVQLVSLFDWSFTALPQTGQGFRALVEGLIDSERATTGALRLPLAESTDLPPQLAERLADGYAPLTFVAGSGDQSFAWYRGPFSATIPQPLPAVGDPPAPVTQATSADALMIYLAEQGLFDLGYAAAWNLGRQLALADGAFVQTLVRCRRAARQALPTLAQRMALPQLAGQPPDTLLSAKPSLRQFSRSMADGLGRRYTAALAGARETGPPPAASVQRPSRFRSRAMLHPLHALAHPDAGTAIVDSLGELTTQAAAWLADLALLRRVPFSALVPDPRMLPVESIRFFYLDANWTEALLAGALSIAVHGSVDLALYRQLLPAFVSATGGPRSGMLVRSQLVPDWPQLVVGGSLGGAPLPVLRDECLAPSVRLTLFDGIPDTVTLAEPYRGLRFGIEDDGIHPRCVTSAALAGALFANAAPVAPQLRPAASGSIGGVVEVAAQAALLQAAAGVAPFLPGAVVEWNGTALATTFVSGTRLTAVVPAELTAAEATAAVAVRSSGASSQPLAFAIEAALAISSINPVRIRAGSAAFTCEVAGVGFAAGTVVEWNGTPLVTTLVSAALVGAAVPAELVAGPGTAAITVRTGDTTSNAVPLRIVGGDPVIDALEPGVAMAGSTGFTLTVTGSGFTPDAIVQWNGTTLTSSVDGEGQLTAAVPAALVAAPGSAAVTVMVNGTASAPATFTIAAGEPVIGGIQPAVAIAGGGGFTLVVTGAGFAADAQIEWNGKPLATTVADAGELTAGVAADLIAGAGAATITVSSGGVRSAAATFGVIGLQPAIGLLEPAAVVAGGGAFTLTVTGGFGAGDYALQLVAAPERQSFLTR